MDLAPPSTDRAQSDETGGSKQGEERRLADRIEDTIRGFLDFVASFVRTSGYAASLKRIVSAGHRRGLVKPLTYLCCSFLPYAAILDVSASSIWDFLITPEVSATKLAHQLQDISPTKILVIAIPALLSVYLGCAILARVVFRTKGLRRSYVDSMCYAFGLQFSSTVLLIGLITLGHERFAVTLVPRWILDVIVWPIAATGVIYLLALAAALYPLIVSVALVRPLNDGRKHTFALRMVSCLGAVAISVVTYWFGVLPERFKAFVEPPQKVSSQIYPASLKTEGRDKQTLRMGFLLRNPTKHDLVLARDSGLIVNAKVTAVGQPFPKNGFHVQIDTPLDSSPVILIKAGDTAWISGTAKPDYQDWALLRSAISTDQLLFVQVLASDQDGDHTLGDWEQVSLEGPFPSD